MCYHDYNVGGGVSQHTQENGSFLAFSMSIHVPKLQFLCHTTPILWQSRDQIVNILSSPNVNYMCGRSFYHTQWWYTWEWWRVSAMVILPSEWCCVNTTCTGLQVGLHRQAYHRLGETYVCCFYSLAAHRMFYEDRLFPYPSWLRCFCLHPAWKLVVIEKSGKKYHTFPDLHSLTVCISVAL